MNEQYIISILFIILIFLFIWGKFRYDAVALILLALFVILGFIEPQQAFVGLGHPAVITVALVLLISKGLEKSGFISLIGNFFQRIINSEIQFIVILCFVAAFLSSFMNNMELWQCANNNISYMSKYELNPSKFLMPLAFASI